MSACGNSDGNGEKRASKPAGPPTSDGPRHTVWIKDGWYRPQRLRIEVGDQITFENRGKLSHSAKDESRGEIDPSPESDGVTDHSGKDINYASRRGFATHALFPGEPQTVVFKVPRTYNYYCAFHGDRMTGVVEVTRAGGD